MILETSGSELLLAQSQSPMDESEVDTRIPRNISNGSFVRFIDTEQEPLLARSYSVRALKRGRLTTLIGILYAIVGGIIASMTLLLTKSG
jgi:hypothetical protein